MRKLILAKVNPLEIGKGGPGSVFLETQNLIKISMKLSRSW